MNKDVSKAYFQLFPTREENVVVSYSPLAFFEQVLKKAVEQEANNLEAVLATKNNSKLLEIGEGTERHIVDYKQIKEARYVACLALAINKETGLQYRIIMSDNPDVVLDGKENCIPVEVYEAFEFRETGKSTIDVANEVRKVHDIKGRKSYTSGTRLLIVNRKKSDNGYNVSDYIREIKKYKWPFEDISLFLYNKSRGYTFIDVSPKVDPYNPPTIKYNPSLDTSYLF